VGGLKGWQALRPNDHHTTVKMDCHVAALLAVTAVLGCIRCCPVIATKEAIHGLPRRCAPRSDGGVGVHPLLICHDEGQSDPPKLSSRRRK
jgi:hypothetical protein